MRGKQMTEVKILYEDKDILFHLGMFSLGDGGLDECRSLFFGRWLVIPAKANQHYGSVV